MSSTKPILITVEGPEYSGKTSLVNQLYQILPNAKLARLPGGTALGEQLRPIIKTQKISPLAQLGLNFAIMCELYETLSKLEGYDYILLDRNVESIFVYQGLMGKLFNNSDAKYFCRASIKFLVNQFPLFCSQVYRIYLKIDIEHLMKRKFNALDINRDTSSQDIYDNLDRQQFQDMIKFYDMAFSNENDALFFPLELHGEKLIIDAAQNLSVVNIANICFDKITNYEQRS